MSKNVRSLDAIAEEIHQAGRDELFWVGDLLLEAKATCEHGEWGAWIEEEFDWSADTAERYMAVARLASKSARLRNLKVAKTTLYDPLAGKEEEIPAIMTDV